MRQVPWCSGRGLISRWVREERNVSNVSSHQQQDQDYVRGKKIYSPALFAFPLKRPSSSGRVASLTECALLLHAVPAVIITLFVSALRSALGILRISKKNNRESLEGLPPGPDGSRTCWKPCKCASSVRWTMYKARNDENCQRELIAFSARRELLRRGKACDVSYHQENILTFRRRGFPQFRFRGLTAPQECRFQGPSIHFERLRVNTEYGTVSIFSSYGKRI